MTEEEWLTCGNPQQLLTFLRDKVGDRKLRLFAVACSRRHLHLSHDRRVGQVLNVAECFADGVAEDEERSNARKAAQEAAQGRGVVARPDVPKWERRAASLAYYAAARQAIVAAWNVPGVAIEVLVWRAGGYDNCDWQAIIKEEQAVQSDLLRDIFANPFGSATIELARITPTATGLAQAAYEERAIPLGELDSTRLAILSDALEEAGCTDEAILSHLRSPGPHVRGCWALDLILGKE